MNALALIFVMQSVTCLCEFYFCFLCVPSETLIMKWAFKLLNAKCRRWSLCGSGLEADPNKCQRVHEGSHFDHSNELLYCK